MTSIFRLTLHCLHQQVDTLDWSFLFRNTEGLRWIHLGKSRLIHSIKAHLPILPPGKFVS